MLCTAARCTHSADNTIMRILCRVAVGFDRKGNTKFIRYIPKDGVRYLRQESRCSTQEQGVIDDASKLTALVVLAIRTVQNRLLE